MLQQYLQVGVIISTHGLKGEVKVYPTTDNVKRFDDLREVVAAADPDRGGDRLEVEAARYFKNLVILKFRGIDRIEDVQKYLKRNLYVSRKDAVPLQEGEYYVADLIGMKVVRSEDGETLGEVADVLPTGANDVYIVRKGDDKKSEILIPAIKECIRGVDVESGVMTVHLLPGL